MLNQNWNKKAKQCKSFRLLLFLGGKLQAVQYFILFKENGLTRNNAEMKSIWIASRIRIISSRNEQLNKLENWKVAPFSMLHLWGTNHCMSSLEWFPFSS